MLPNDYKCDGQMNIFDYLKPYDAGFLRYHISRMDDSKATSLKGLTRNEFISKVGGKTATMDVGDLRTGQRFFVTDDAAYRPDVDHVPWDDYIAMFKEVWGYEEPIPEIPPDDLLPCDSCGYCVKGCCNYPVTPYAYCVEGNRKIPKYDSFSWDSDINEIYKRLIDFSDKYSLPISKADWEIWEHVPHFGFRMSVALQVARCKLTDSLYKDLNCIVDFAKERNIELSPIEPHYFNTSINDLNEVSSMYIYSMFKDKVRQKREK